MKKSKNVVPEGTWFAVPLPSKRFAVGVVARTSPGVILAYFFKGPSGRPPLLRDVQALSAADAVRVMRVGDLGLLDGTWPILGRDPVWNRGQWTVPVFVRRDELSARAWLVHYADDNPNHVEAEVPTDYDTNIEEDGMYGAGAAEQVLASLA